MIAISLGGSVLVPEKIATGWLKGFRELLLAHKERFAIVCGGGATARAYISAASNLNKLGPKALDSFGIAATRLNALLLVAAFGRHAYPEVICNPKARIATKKKILIAGGWKPGFSTDYVTVALAENLGAKQIINITELPYIYERDPKIYPDAKPIEQLSWQELRALLPEAWSPGLHTPFDPVAARAGQKLKLKLYCIGPDLDNLAKLLRGEKFVGSVVE